MFDKLRQSARTRCCSVNPRLPAVFSACVGLVFSLTTIVQLLFLLGQRHVAVASADREQLLPLFCVFYILVLVLKASSELLLFCGAYKRNIGEMSAGLVINKITVSLLIFGVAVCALLRHDLAAIVAAYTLVLIAISVCVWLSAFAAYKSFELAAVDDQPLSLLTADELAATIQIV